MTRCTRAAAAAALLALVACGGSPRGDAAADVAEITRLLEQERTAHLEKRAELLTSIWADTVLRVVQGTVAPQTAAEAGPRLQEYFDRSTFQAWDDIAAPIVRVSADGRMAYAVVRKRVRLTAPDETGRPVAEHVELAWLEVYEKIDGRWRIVAISSSERPGSDG